MAANISEKPAKKQAKKTKAIAEQKLRSLKVVEVKTKDGTVIPIPAHFLGPICEVRVDGDGSCTKDQKYHYLVTVLNSKKDPSAAAKQLASDAAGEIVNNVKDELIQAGLRALRQEKVVQYAIKSLKVIGSAPVTIVKALFFDSTDTGQAREGAIFVELDAGYLVAIRWIG